MKDTVQVVAFECDGCHKRKLVNEEIDGAPKGFHGTVAEVHEGGGSGRVEFYACTPRCLSAAIRNAVKASYEDERTDPGLTAEDLREELADKAQARDLADGPDGELAGVSELETAQA